jgi:hypothetical protein
MSTSGLVIDQIARRVLMASILYYRHDVSVMSDGEFDEMCHRLAFRWLALDEWLRWQLGSSHDMGASGVHCKITQACEGGALAWAKKRLLVTLPRIPQEEWRWCEERSVYWTTAG